MKLKQTIALTALTFIPAGLMAAEPQTGTGETDGYRLVWQDLFDAGNLNRDRWNIEVNGNGGGNEELQYYTDRASNVSVGDDGQGNGCLILTARREDYSGKHFTSGRITTLDNVTFTHGKIEASIKIPSTANGLWPAFWMMGNDISTVGWPTCSETDIMEMGHSDGITRGVQDKMFNGALHWGTAWNHTGDVAKTRINRYSIQDGEFHLFTVIWDEKHIAMYLDLDKYPDTTPYLECELTDMTPDNDRAIGKYFHKPNFILFNLAVGGNFPGIHDANKITALNDDNGQSASMYVNYVKVYQKGDASETLYTKVPGDPQPESSITVIETETPEGPADFFTLQGVKVSEPVRGQIYIVRHADGLASKIVY
mgnify:FL=1